MSRPPNPKLGIDDAKLWHDVLMTLTDLRKRTDVRIGAYSEPDVSIGGNGIVFRLVWADEGYELQEQYR